MNPFHRRNSYPLSVYMALIIFMRVNPIYFTPSFYFDGNNLPNDLILSVNIIPLGAATRELCSKLTSNLKV